MKIILGTVSKYRKQVFEEMGYKDFEVMSADINEKAIQHESPREVDSIIGLPKELTEKLLREVQI